jgi:hypothetical protein
MYPFRANVGTLANLKLTLAQSGALNIDSAAPREKDLT